MSEFLAALEATEAAQFFRTSRLGYAALSAVHILGIALLVGAVMSLNLRLLGVWKTTSLSALTRVLVPVAAAGLMLAVVTGGFLFSVRATEYLGIGFLRAKVVLVALGIVSAVTIHSAYGLTLDGASRERRVFHALLSTACWLGALACGRLIAFAVD